MDTIEDRLNRTIADLEKEYNSAKAKVESIGKVLAKLLDVRGASSTDAPALFADAPKTGKRKGSNGAVEAAAAMKVIEEAGSEGAKAGDIRAAAGLSKQEKIEPFLAEFGHKAKSKGKGPGTRYFPA